MVKIMFGVKTPQKHDFGGLIRHFKPNLRNFWIAIEKYTKFEGDFQEHK